ncbi:MAG: hypothetical protein BWY78_00155 [Alphaproteobacteria bacterium ADurb.Bin438]|nr:MAG: hypothetical protein BWY78_00155 [Alphaproteobacteria bacterium ADurb.Bin438]
MAIDPTASPSLSMGDVQRLISDNSPESRAIAAEKIAASYSHENFVNVEKKIAEDIFRLLAKDVEERVRVVLSENLMQSEDLPRDVALTLAHDISDIVANPILQFSKLLTSDDLIEIIKEGNESRQVAIASRETVETSVSSVLAEVGKEKAVETLVRNEGAKIDETAFSKVMDRFGDKENIQHGLTMRSALPSSIAGRLLDKVSEDLKKHLIQKHNIDPSKAKTIISQSRDKATVNVTSMVTDEETQSIVYGLKQKNKLTPSIILRALCSGETIFFENSIALLTKLPVANIRKLVYDTGPLGLPALYEKAGLPARMFPAARIAIDLIKETNYKGGDADIQESFSRMVVGRLMEQLRDVMDDVQEDADIETLLALLEEE